MDHGSIGREGDQAAGLPFDAAAAATSEAAARHPSEMTTDVMSAAIVHVDVTGATQRAERRALVADAFGQYHAEIYNFLRRSTRDESVAEDLVQETFVRLNREVEAGRTPEHLRAWLYRVASNLVISRGRRSSTVIAWINRHGRAAAMRYEDSPETGYLRQEQASALGDVLMLLSAEARAALLLSADGFSGEEIAAAIGRTHGATRTLLSRARVKVRLELERREQAR
jgi:RNA polymerase sigma factor (sigma-70 family)